MSTHAILHELGGALRYVHTELSIRIVLAMESDGSGMSISVALLRVQC